MSRPKLRATVVAALLLLPLAALVAPAAQAETRAAVAQPAITNMSLNSDGGLSPGATLRVQVYATRNARNASLTLGESGITVPLRQQTAGNYTGTYVVRRSDRIDPMQLMTARVTFGERTYSRQFNFPPGFQALAMGAQRETAPRDHDDSRGRRDARAPQITDLTPDNGERVGDRGRTQVSARLSDEGSGIDRDSVRLRLNGRDVSQDVRVSDDEAVYRADLAPGRYTAELTVRDRAGNATTKSWGFDVAAHGERYGGGPFPLTVTNYQNNAVVDANGDLAIRGRTAPFANVRVQVESVANMAGLIGVSQPVADQTVQADREGRFGVVVTPRGLPIPGTRYDVRLTATSGDRTAEERLTLIQRQG
jgi:hypothetical protein